MSVSSPVETLRHAHDVGQGKLKLLTGAASELDEGRKPAALSTLKEVLKFFDGELRLHFRHEEEAFFPALERVTGREGLITVMRDEHQSLWRAVEALREKIDQLESDGESGRNKIAQEVERIAAHIEGLLGSHIKKENSMLFPLAERTLSAPTMLEMAERMREVQVA